MFVGVRVGRGVCVEGGGFTPELFRSQVSERLNRRFFNIHPVAMSLNAKSFDLDVSESPNLDIEDFNILFGSQNIKYRTFNKAMTPGCLKL